MEVRTPGEMEKYLSKKVNKLRKIKEKNSKKHDNRMVEMLKNEMRSEEDI